MKLEQVKDIIRDVYDFPTKGIVFKDLIFAVSGENCDGFGGVCCHLVIVECALVLRRASQWHNRLRRSGRAGTYCRNQCTPIGS